MSDSLCKKCPAGIPDSESFDSVAGLHGIGRLSFQCFIWTDWEENHRVVSEDYHDPLSPRFPKNGSCQVYFSILKSRWYLPLLLFDGAIPVPILSRAGSSFRVLPLAVPLLVIFSVPGSVGGPGAGEFRENVLCTLQLPAGRGSSIRFNGKAKFSVMAIFYRSTGCLKRSSARMKLSISAKFPFRRRRSPVNVSKHTTARRQRGQQTLTEVKFCTCLLILRRKQFRVFSPALPNPRRDRQLQSQLTGNHRRRSARCCRVWRLNIPYRAHPIWQNHRAYRPEAEPLHSESLSHN